ncbi:hypothetical protein [Flavobacterium psychrotrophum]|uniref:hypothetical protein n=1 Tax=Flavobacterium psychrotrophum TaxID=2294119 RepID=UPI000E31BE6C|nr:hypothetical protein [Flavobacterium psychrotrophum]
MQAITLNYLYRDSSNYKNFGSVNFSNPTNISIEEIETAIQSNLIDGEYFVAEDWGLPTLYFDEWTEDDHYWHEFLNIEITEIQDEFISISLFLRSMPKQKTGL